MLKNSLWHRVSYNILGLLVNTLVTTQTKVLTIYRENLSPTSLPRYELQRYSLIFHKIPKYKFIF